MAVAQLLLDASLLSVGVLLLAHLFRRKPPAPYPPGPKGYPIIGNLLDLPAAYPWRTFTEWGQKYGDIVYLSSLGQSILVINSAKLAAELLDKKSSITADRPPYQMASELVGWKSAMAMSRYGHQFREYRKYMHRSMGSKHIVENHHELMIAENRKFLRRMLTSKEDIGVEIRKNAGAIILKLAYGYSAAEGHDPIVDLVERAMDTLKVSITPGAWLVDLVPALRYIPSWFPGAKFKREAKWMNQLVQDMAEVPFVLTKEAISNHADLPPNLISDCLEGKTLDPENEFYVKWAAASLYSGGADTTVSAIHTFVLAMVLYPEHQKRAQAEIDLVVGDERLPSFEDRPNLPFIESIVKEIFRWKPLAPTTLPHRMMQDDVHDGYFIPKGTSVFGNIWAILRDPEAYPNGDEFDPSRYVTETGELTDVPNPYDVCFGYGRRICPGMHFADSSVFIWVAMILQVYEFSKVVENGVVIEPPVDDYTTGAVMHPKPFKYAMKPRSAKAQALILSTD
ncbi:cytochrome P450 [Cytidiella melzeri]|nr:cytochrome P450 [Cytidiella melzeri]